MSEKPFIYDLDLSEIIQMLESWGEPGYRALQIWQGLYRQLWNQAEQFTSLPRDLRRRLSEAFRFSRLEPETILDSSDGETRKTLFRLPDGQPVEAVLMRYRRRRTLCISTQVGCAMGCVFCATGQMGFRRHLTSGEIVEQVLYYARMLAEQGEKVSNVVLMGMGEPFHNYEASMAAIDRLNHPEGFHLGARRFTVSTVGLAPVIRRFAVEHPQVNLAISLHAADDELRASMLPINKKYPLVEVLAACRDYIQATGRRITFEWALIRDINDSLEQARKLALLLREFKRNGAALCHVNVIPLNPTARYSGQATTHDRARAFQAELERHGVPCTVRLRRGVDIQAGCGQLAGVKQPSPSGASA